MTDEIRYIESENKIILQLSGAAATDDDLVEELYRLYRQFKRKYSEKTQSQQPLAAHNATITDDESYDSMSKIEFLKRVIVSFRASTYFTAKDLEDTCTQVGQQFTSSTISEYLKRLAKENFLIRNEDERPITYGLNDHAASLTHYEFDAKQRTVRMITPQIAKN